MLEPAGPTTNESNGPGGPIHPRLCSAIEALPLAAFRVGADLRVRHANDTAAAWYGQPATWFVNRGVDEVIGAEGLAEQAPAMARVLAGETVRLSHRIVDRVGAERWVHVVAVPIADPPRPAEGFFVFPQEFSAQVHAERTAAASDARHLRLLDLLPCGVCEVDLQGRFTYSNPAHARMLGCRPAELLGRSCLDFIPPEDRGAARKVFDGLSSERRQPAPYHSLHRRADGSEFHGRVDWGYRYADDGTLRGLVGVLTDVSADAEADRALQAVRESDQRLRALLDQLPAVVWTFDADLRVAAVAGSGLAPLGCHHAIPGWPPAEESFGHLLADSEAVAAHRKALAGETASYRTEKSGKSFLAHVQPLNGPDDTVTGVIGVALDVTSVEQIRRERDETRERARHAVHAQEQERTRLAHELHDSVLQMLAATALRLGALELEGVSESVSDELAQARAEVVRIGNEIRRICTGLRPPELDELGLAAAVRRLIDEWSERTGVPCELHIGDLPTPDATDAPLALYRGVQEALRNTERHAAAGRVWLRLACDDAAYDLEVRDDGRGASPLALEPSARRNGLRNLRERMAALGGLVEVATAPDRGFSLRCRVPTAVGARRR